MENSGKCNNRGRGGGGVNGVGEKRRRVENLLSLINEIDGRLKRLKKSLIINQCSRLRGNQLLEYVLLAKSQIENVR